MRGVTGVQQSPRYSGRATTPPLISCDWLGAAGRDEGAAYPQQLPFPTDVYDSRYRPTVESSATVLAILELQIDGRCVAPDHSENSIDSQ